MEKTLKTEIGYFVSIFLSLLGIVFTLYFGESGIKEFLKSASLPVLFFSGAFFLSIAGYYYYMIHKNIRFYKDRDHVPRLFKIHHMLQYVAKGKHNLYVMGRTNVSWFSAMDEGIGSLYHWAINQGCKIVFIIQSKHVLNEYLNDETKKKIISDFTDVTDKYKRFVAKYGKSRNFQLYLTNERIENSITMVTSVDEKKVLYFSYDIGQNIDRKPFIVFKRNSVFEELKGKFEQIQSKSILYEDFENRNDKAQIEYEQLIGQYRQYSSQRDNNNEKLVPYFVQNRTTFKSRVKTAPVSIQFLITNSCTTPCVMCNHHEIGSNGELKKPEVESILRCIADIGTRNVIISGGEPLKRDFCIDMLGFANDSLKLNIGLLTNGIKNGGKSLTPDDASKLSKACKWIQLSIDSFEPASYKMIRKIDYDIVRESVENLEKAGANLEVCFTIQRQNIDEAIELISGQRRKEVRSKVRFKFAHGPDLKEEFLLFDQGKEKIREFLNYSGDSKEYNTKYMYDMFDKGYFTIDDVANGTPLQEFNRSSQKNGFKCHILHLSCKIDARGNVYPCCFLFDDNQGKSNLRDSYSIGTLKSPGTGIVSSPLQGHNLLRDLWFGGNNIDLFMNRIIPVDEQACNNCTRHFYQNEFLNKLDSMLIKYEDIAFDSTIRKPSDEVFWI